MHYYIYFKIYYIDSSKMMGNFPEVLNFNRLFLKLNQFICNGQRERERFKFVGEKVSDYPKK
jgi:hypothetical protein